MALRLTRWAFKDCQVTEDRSEQTSQLRASRLADTWIAAVASGARDAQSDIDQGKIVELTFGLVRDRYETCSTCLIRWKTSPSSGGTSCRRCGARLIPLKTLGCMVGDSTEGRVAGYNRAIEVHLRAEGNLDFSWAKVVTKDDAPRAEDKPPSPV